jgi:cytochrome c oxidase subunit 1
MFIQGLAGMSRRMYDGGATYAEMPGVPGLSPFVLNLNKVISYAAFSLAIAQIPFIINFFWSIKHGKKITSDNPWDATTLEWQTPTPPGHGNFTKPIEVFRGPYEYSVPGCPTDFLPQNDPGNAKTLTHEHTVHR